MVLRREQSSCLADLFAFRPSLHQPGDFIALELQASVIEDELFGSF